MNQRMNSSRYIASASAIVHVIVASLTRVYSILSVLLAYFIAGVSREVLLESLTGKEGP
jgi:hypothetical protein